MDHWPFIGAQLHSVLDQGAALLLRVPDTWAFGGILLPVVLAIFSKRIIIVLAALIFSIIAFYFFVEPSNVVVTLAFGTYSASLIIALSGIAAHRKAKSLQADLGKLRRVVNDLLAADERRLLSQLKSSVGDRMVDRPTISEDPPA